MIIVCILMESGIRENYRFLDLAWGGADSRAGWSIVPLIVSSFHAFFMFHALIKSGIAIKIGTISTKVAIRQTMAAIIYDL